MAPSACLVVALIVALFLTCSGVQTSDATEMEMAFRQRNEDSPSDEVEFLRKRASNLGSRLMCRLDSRNCGAFNMGKKFGGYSWLRSADSTRRRLEYFLGNKWQRDADSLGQFQNGDADEYWQPNN
ncbi:uncharacterized protein LOC110833406 [Zootermopsis nevadensis]|uniref:uncharacterized protein LOC110833406 n=1 Tax=Zootermopsis nevadensis TaxID=136037 RepID=UPI000B8E25CA|nr:uncharacterized protein LOC110833406 [Zootermopsis nevadensis]